MRAKQERENKTFKLDSTEEEDKSTGIMGD